MVTLLRHLTVKSREWLGNTDLLVLLAVLVVVGGVWGFVELAGAVTAGSTQEVDESIIRSLRERTNFSKPLGPWLKEAGRDLSALGGRAVLVLVTTAVIGYLFFNRKYQALVFLLVATLGGVAVVTFLKQFYDRPRPQVEPHLSEVTSPSFPSGHSMLSAVVYLTLGTLMARLVERRLLKVYFLSVAMLFTFLVGLSRVYVAVHYPTDVLAGWTAGLVWALLCWLAARYLQRRGAIEKSASE